MPQELTGWLLDLYADPQDGLALWLMEESDAIAVKDPAQASSGPRYRLRQSFPITFYAAGPTPRLRALWKYLHSQEAFINLSRTERRDLFQPKPVTLLAIQVPNPAHQPRLFARISREFPDLTYYDADIPLPLRHAAVYGTFPLARLKVVIDDHDFIQAIYPLDSPWELDPETPPLRIMTLEPDRDPRRTPPQFLNIHFRRWRYRLPLPSSSARPFLLNLSAILTRHDPDLLLTAWGDTWLLPLLLELSQQSGIPLPLNRDQEREVLRKAERSYFTYGQIVHRGGQVQLFGRWHIDMYNAMMYHDYRLEGVLESARVTAQPVQDAARLSPGTGISAMQIITALRQEILVPWHKQQAESPKTALDLLHADQGGLVYQPIIGLHRDVAEIDFVSMYPSIMAHFNISPEQCTSSPAVGELAPNAVKVPELNLWINDSETLGLVPQTLRPLLEKRIALKNKAASLPHWDPRRTAYKAQASAHKWLLVTCFGYLGYKNARFGRIEAHQAVTAYSRECLLRAKEAIEDAGGIVLHMYVDGLWVQKPGCKAVQDFQPILDEILERTHLPIGLEGIYRWVAFLPSRTNARLPVANRYFGVFQDGSLKIRGIEARRHDTPPFIAETQMGILEILSQAPRAEDLPQYLPEVMRLLRRKLRELRSGRLPLAQCLVTQKLSRELAAYRSLSPAALAAAQLEKAGKHTRPGQHVRFLYTLGDPGIVAWDLPQVGADLRACLPKIDAARYIELLLRAASTVLQPLGITETILRDWLLNNAGYVSPPGNLPSPIASASLWPAQSPLAALQPGVGSSQSREKDPRAAHLPGEDSRAGYPESLPVPALLEN
jgi:DNA polymerase-2